jgi:hypothetical protein
MAHGVVDGKRVRCTDNIVLGASELWTELGAVLA